MFVRALLSLVVMIALALPSAADGDDLAALAGTNWQLIRLDGKPVAPGTASTLVISADNVGGNGGCNTYGGELASTPDGGLDISQIFSTMMACDALEQEQAFFAALEAANAFALVDGNLQLLDNGSVRAELAPAS